MVLPLNPRAGVNTKAPVARSTSVRLPALAGTSTVGAGTQERATATHYSSRVQVAKRALQLQQSTLQTSWQLAACAQRGDDRPRPRPGAPAHL